jgi:hypothetical protein
LEVCFYNLFLFVFSVISLFVILEAESERVSAQQYDVGCISTYDLLFSEGVATGLAQEYVSVVDVPHAVALDFRILDRDPVALIAGWDAYGACYMFAE